MQLLVLAIVMGLINWVHKMEIGYNTGPFPLYSFANSTCTSAVILIQDLCGISSSLSYFVLKPMKVTSSTQQVIAKRPGTIIQFVRIVYKC